MKKYQSMPDQLVTCWVDEDVHEEPGKVYFHYHSVEEWLKILKGEVTFFSAGNRHKYPLGEGQALNIPQGEVHRVEIGSSGVTYRMWTPVELPKPFRLDLDQDVLQLIERNLKVPEQENQWDRRDPSTPWEELQEKEVPERLCIRGFDLPHRRGWSFARRRTTCGENLPPPSGGSLPAPSAFWTCGRRNSRAP